MNYGRILLDSFVSTPEGKTVSMRIDPVSKKLFGKTSDGEEYNLSGNDSNESIIFSRTSQPIPTDSSYMNMRVDPETFKIYLMNSDGVETEVSGGSEGGYSYDNVLFVHSKADPEKSEKGNPSLAYSNMYDAYRNYSDGDIVILMNDTFIGEMGPVDLKAFGISIIADDSVGLYRASGYSGPIFSGGGDILISGGIIGDFGNHGSAMIYKSGKVSSKIDISCKSIDVKEFISVYEIESKTDINIKAEDIIITCGNSGGISAAHTSLTQVNIESGNILFVSDISSTTNVISSAYVNIRARTLNVSSKSDSAMSNTDSSIVVFKRAILDCKTVLSIKNRRFISGLYSSGDVQVETGDIDIDMMDGSCEVFKEVKNLKTGRVRLNSNIISGNIIFNQCGVGGSVSTDRLHTTNLYGYGSGVSMFVSCENISIINGINVSRAVLFDSCSNIEVFGNIDLFNMEGTPSGQSVFFSCATGAASKNITVNGGVKSSYMFRLNRTAGATLLNVVIHGDVETVGNIEDVAKITLNGDIKCHRFVNCLGITISEESTIRIEKSIPSYLGVFERIGSWDHVSKISGRLIIANAVNSPTYIYDRPINTKIEGLIYKGENTDEELLPVFIKLSSRAGEYDSKVFIGNGNDIRVRDEDGSFISVPSGDSALTLSGKTYIAGNSENISSDFNNILNEGSGVLIFNDKSVSRSYFSQGNERNIVASVDYDFDTGSGETKMIIPYTFFEGIRSDSGESYGIHVAVELVISGYVYSGNTDPPYENKRFIDKIKGVLTGSRYNGFTDFYLNEELPDRFGADAIDYSASMIGDGEGNTELHIDMTAKDTVIASGCATLINITDFIRDDS